MTYAATFCKRKQLLEQQSVQAQSALCQMPSGLRVLNELVTQLCDGNPLPGLCDSFAVNIPFPHYLLRSSPIAEFERFPNMFARPGVGASNPDHTLTAICATG